MLRSNGFLVQLLKLLVFNTFLVASEDAELKTGNFQLCLTSATSVTSEGAQGIFSEITFLKSVRSNEKDEVCHSFLVEIFTKSLHRGGVY